MEVAQAPTTREELAQLLAAAGAEGTPVRFDGGGSKAGWAARTAEPLTDLSTAGLDRIVEHNAGDLTAVLEGGVTLAAAQAAFADAGQMLALDPPDNGATIGGIVATADSGPLRSRYGGVRDLVVGMRVALSDGTLAKSGGKVIKNVAGYDLAKLFAGSFGTLGAIVEVAVRLHPLQPSSATAVGSASDMNDLSRAAIALSREPLEHAGFDVRWSEGGGALLVRFAGAAPEPQAETAARLLGEAGLANEIVEDDEPALVRAARAPARGSDDEAVVRVSGASHQAARAGGGRRADRRQSRRPGATRALLAAHPRGVGREPGGPSLRARALPLRVPRPAGRARGGPVGSRRRGRARADAARQGRLRPSGRLQPRNLRGWPVSGYDDTRAPQLELIDDCVHCGFCLPTCPTYSLWGEEMDSPRGRIVLMKEGHEEISAPLVQHLDNCLGCMACVTACPSGVQYDKLLEDARAQVERNFERPPAERAHRRLVFELFTRPGRLRAAAPGLERGAGARARPHRPPAARAPACAASLGPGHPGAGRVA